MRRVARSEPAFVRENISGHVVNSHVFFWFQMRSRNPLPDLCLTPALLLPDILAASSGVLPIACFKRLSALDPVCLFLCRADQEP